MATLYIDVYQPTSVGCIKRAGRYWLIATASQQFRFCVDNGIWNSVPPGQSIAVSVRNNLKYDAANDGLIAQIGETEGQEIMYIQPPTTLSLFTFANPAIGVQVSSNTTLYDRAVLGLSGQLVIGLGAGERTWTVRAGNVDGRTGGGTVNTAATTLLLAGGNSAGTVLGVTLPIYVPGGSALQPYVQGLQGDDQISDVKAICRRI